MLLLDPLTILLVLVGGSLGGMLRWALSRIPKARVGTWAANVVACTVLGYSAALPGVLPLLVGTGFAGALSTWSTLAKELGTLWKAKQYWLLCRYSLSTAFVGLAAAIWGSYLGGIGIILQ